MMTLKELCKCFKYFSKESSVFVHFENGDSLKLKWEEACRICRYTVKRFKVTSLIAKNIIVLQVWI